VILSAYAGGDLDLSTPEGAYYGGMETLRAKRESAVRSVRVREAHERIAREGKSSGGGRRWFGYTRVFANPEETVRRKRVILREEVNPTEADALRDAAERILRGETVGSIIREWTQRGIKPSGGGKWEETSLVNTLKSPRLAGLREWAPDVQGDSLGVQRRAEQAAAQRGCEGAGPGRRSRSPGGPARTAALPRPAAGAGVAAGARPARCRCPRRGARAGRRW